MDVTRRQRRGRRYNIVFMNTNVKYAWLSKRQEKKADRKCSMCIYFFMLIILLYMYIFIYWVRRLSRVELPYDSVG